MSKMELDKFIQSIEQGVEDMKCCGNCIYKNCPNFWSSGYCGTWSFDGWTSGDRRK